MITLAIIQSAFTIVAVCCTIMIGASRNVEIPEVEEELDSFIDSFNLETGL